MSEQTGGGMNELTPPLFDEVAPASVCSRWMGTSPCGAVATWHVIWDLEMNNGAVCEDHKAEARRLWVFIGMHPYSPACAAGGLWFPAEDVCRIEGTDQQAAVAAEAEHG